MRVDGSDVRRLTLDPGKDLDPSVSPDGSRVVFDSDRDGPVAIFVMDSDGGNPTNLSRPTQPGHIFPTWSPDGLQIAYACGPTFEGMDICVMSADGSGQHILVAAPESIDWEPAWSPDGSRIAFVSDRDGNLEIYLIGADGQDLVRLTTSPDRDADPAWSPDGSHLAFDAIRDGRQGIFLMGPTGANVTRLTEGHDVSPSWSPDGGRIAFYRQVGDGTFIFTIRVDGSDLLRLTH